MDARGKLAKGIDPSVSAKRRVARREADRSLTLRKAIDDWLADVAPAFKSPKSTAIRERALRVHFAPYDERDVTTITAKDVAGILRALAPETAKKDHAAETLVLGADGLLAARSAKTAIAETHLAEVRTAFDATRADAARRDREREQLAADVAAARKHSEEIGREVVALQSNPSVSAYPKGFHDWALERRNVWFAGFNAEWIYCRRRDQPTAACKRQRRNIL